MFWLSHHHEGALHRCYRLFGALVCARCLGTYPVLFLAFFAQFALHAPLRHPVDVPVGLALVVPATLDWAIGQFWPHASCNPLRSLTGVLLGLGLARSLFIHVQQPLPLVLLWQLGLVTAVSFPVILMTYLRRSGR
jgi:uncharacterized membrane protein